MRLYKEEFTSLESFQARLSNTPNGYGKASVTGSESFTGTKSYEYAEELLKYGWIDGVQRAKELTGYNKLDNVTREASTMVRPENTVVGYMPHVPNAIMNIPNSMIRVQRVPKKIKTIDILYNISVQAGVRPEEIMRASSQLLRYIMDAEVNGIRVNLRIMNLVLHESKLYTPIIQIKDYRSNINMQKLAYIIGHPSMLRRQIFKWCEVVPASEIPSSFFMGYGRPEPVSSIRKDFPDSMLVDVKDLLNDSNYFRNK